MQCAVDPTITSELSEDDSGYEYEYDAHETEVGILLLTLFETCLNPRQRVSLRNSAMCFFSLAISVEVTNRHALLITNHDADILCQPRPNLS